MCKLLLRRGKLRFARGDGCLRFLQLPALGRDLPLGRRNLRAPRLQRIICVRKRLFCVLVLLLCLVQFRLSFVDLLLILRADGL